MSDHTLLIAVQTIIENNTRTIRNKQVILDTELALLYEVTIEYLRKRVKKENARLPKDFMFQLTQEEYNKITTNTATKQLPYAFTEGGIMMLGGILKTPKANKIHLQVIDYFVQLYKEALQIKEVMEKLNQYKNDEETKEIFTVLEHMITTKK